MRTLYFLLITTLLFTACNSGSSKEDLFRDIKNLEQSDELGTPEGLAKLAKLHEEYGLEYKDSLANNFLYAAAMYHFYSGEKEKSESLFTTYIGRDDSSSMCRNAKVNLAVLYGKSQEYDKMDVMVDQVLKDYEPTNTQVNDMLKLYTEKIEKDINVDAEDYVKQSMCFTGLQLFDKAVEALSSAASRFPEYDKRANLLYRAGFISWEYQKNSEQAKAFYNQFLQEYPNHELAPEVQKILDSGMLEMSDEEILEMLKSQNQG
ncbi:tetratricopeptide repeat protein [bacterium]|nr:tetratricopeptide repeat protein [bacterium]